jgi:ABC-2 type transport system ATP-binding protein
VVAQHNIQQFLRHYQEQRGTTILLTSHYMKDVAALCRRVVIIANGLIHYDGSLGGIIDRFSRHKRVTLLFAEEQLPVDLQQYGRVLSSAAPKATLEIERQQVARSLAAILDKYVVEDVSVEDLPLEEVIAGMFSEVSEHATVGN